MNSTAPAPPKPPEYYTVAQVAARLNVSKMTIYRMVDDEALPGGFRLGPKMVRIHAHTFDKWLAGQHSHAGSANA